MRKRGRGGQGRGSRGGRGRRDGSGSRGGEGGLLHRRLARQELLEHRVHLTADHLLREQGEEKQTARERNRDMEGNENVASVTLVQ